VAVAVDRGDGRMLRARDMVCRGGGDFLQHDGNVLR
jgi:hypothetical protein